MFSQVSICSRGVGISGTKSLLGDGDVQGYVHEVGGYVHGVLTPDMGPQGALTPGHGV